MYERSFMHVETVSHTACAAGDFIITGSKVQRLLAPLRLPFLQLLIHVILGRYCQILEEKTA
jgi:hypothetical protein